MTEILGSGDEAEQEDAPSEGAQSESVKEIESTLAAPLEPPTDVIEEVIIQDLQLPAEPGSINDQEKPLEAPLDSSGSGGIE
jgi:hypothetical protein